jgi:tryptophan synthase alpha chain
VPQRLAIAELFRQTRAQQRLALMPFVPAGYPSLDLTRALVPALEAAGADLVEIGIPFSDPIADGPVIQEAFHEALLKNLHVEDVMGAVADVRKRVSIPLVAMVSYSIVFRFGVERFVARAKQAGFDGLILPDLPPPEAQDICGLIRAGGLDPVLLVAPTTRPPRREEIARLSSGFLYYLSVSGVTGERDQLPPELAAGVKQMRSLSDTPVCVGFGIARPEHVRSLRGVADGAIVGSALVRRIRDTLRSGGDEPAAIAAAARLCQDLAAGCRGG